MVSKDSPTVDVEEAVEEAKGVFRRLINELTKSSNTKQVAIGGISGWCTGYLAMKVGKSAAAALGGTIFVIQIAQYKGYININWSKVNKDLEKASEKLGGPSSNKLDKTFDKVMRYSKENGYLATGFLGGFLIGVGSA